MLHHTGDWQVLPPALTSHLIPTKARVHQRKQFGTSIGAPHGKRRLAGIIMQMDTTYHDKYDTHFEKNSEMYK
jgi:hypothetical protein